MQIVLCFQVCLSLSTCLHDLIYSALRERFNDEEMQRLEELGSRDKIIELAEEMMKKGVMEKKTTKKSRQKAKKKLAKEEEPEMKSGEVSREASYEQDCAQGRAYFLSKDYPRCAWWMLWKNLI